MNAPLRLGPSLVAAIEHLIEAADSPARDLALLSAALFSTSGRAAALWRHGASGWRPVIARGETELLPNDELVQAVLGGRLSQDLLPPGLVLARTGGEELHLG